ncbi:glycosyl hydrolase [Paenibacillus polymyxa]|uniref:glycosyl hydrolase n=1 Tax=Paenibacillus sp. FSL R5-192 TaxID=1226754 RepID=UPI0003E281E9|nr:glycosyl hydrolase [Paenibacillus sp. FSL R5-192]ETT31396.1 glycoside hydrolase [Paenibacillus sp. FSL R5-192]
MRKMTEVLENRENNYILPFFWQHGEEELVLREHMQIIDESGIKAVCVESRPHPDFVGPQWWTDLDIIMDEARNRKMKVWILDDSHFPTGYAAGRIKTDYPQYQKQFLKIHQQDFVGPQLQAGILVKWALQRPGQRGISVGVEQVKSDHEGEQKQVFSAKDRIVGVVAARKTGPDEIDPDSLVDLTSQLHEGTVQWDLPEGRWRIFTLVLTYDGGEKATEGYLNPIVPEATQVLIDTVYEAHYDRYKDDFGSTLAGFFSDEPRFGNVKGPLASIGRLDMILPWCEDLQDMLKQEGSDDDVIRSLPLLWANAGVKGQEMRYRYMDLITRLYAEHFTDRLGEWCRAHGVEYIGHVIEDNNAHARLGYGTGHFYRSLWGQDMSGIDVVLHQILPGMDDGYYKSFTSTGWDGEFFHYGMAKMGTSLGHLDPKKHGRTMCEVYGAYGFGEGLKLMKWLTDHMLVRGVNHFVPHAFSPKKYPDPDCPPHLYANGYDPQYRYLPILAYYMNRVSHLLSDGVHVAPAAILYHAEAEWAGEYMLFQKPARELTQNQIDFDIVPSELVISAQVKDGKLQMNREQFPALIIPYAEALPSQLIAQLVAYAEAGLQVYFVDGLPARSSEGEDCTSELSDLKKHKSVSIVALDELATRLRSDHVYEITVSEYQPYLRYYHYRHNDGEVYMFFNEDPAKAIETTITVPALKGVDEMYIYNAFANTLSPLHTRMYGNKQSFSLRLEKYESVLIVQGTALSEEIAEVSTAHCSYTNLHEITGEWKLSLATAKQYPEFSAYGTCAELTSLAVPTMLPEFSGTVRYEIEFDMHEVPAAARLVIHEPYEVAQVWLNGHDIGTRICPPYAYEASGYLEPKGNRLVIEVTNTLVKEQQDFLSQFLIQEPTGIVGNVYLEY